MCFHLCYFYDCHCTLMLNKSILCNFFFQIMETERPLCNTKSFDNDGLSMRLQDKDIQEMSDRGVCLSMHQPYASLLVENIKR